MAAKEKKDPLNLDIPESRGALLYVRIKESNKEFLKEEAAKRKRTMTEVVDAIFDKAREQAN